ncbi:hypothetical protein RFI_05785 [Reticulomyxa filosa]|uniref:Uncharacterized protein n=1 Tax=Reticulomyxa filosa TaxID=46433 RepID=X6NZE8_RETFI|nr:hypothetical protein RFI_05785 [Reticulomyxa filosa]|eukprot:ETO31336.1 hypothetical protein RFI_05785 [Reticulomyxa filosa]
MSANLRLRKKFAFIYFFFELFAKNVPTHFFKIILKKKKLQTTKPISMTCVLVELLKRQKIAKVTKIATDVNLSPNFRRYGGNVAWGQPVPTIVFHLVRGEHATYVSSFHQRKVIEIFEGKDPSHSGKLGKKTVDELTLGQIFLATPEQKTREEKEGRDKSLKKRKNNATNFCNQEQAKKYLQEINGNDVNLPHFIRYCSLLIHPLLKDSVFKSKLTILGIGSQDEQRQEE